MAQPPGVLLLAADPDLGVLLSEAEFAVARDRVVAPRLVMEAGVVELSQLTDHERLRGPLFGALVLQGALMTSVLLGGRESRQLLGSGDFVAPLEPKLPTLPGKVSLLVERSAVMALLDDRFVAACVRWPGLFAQFCYRLNAQARAGLVRQAIVQLPRVEDRLLAMFWALSERWGRIEPAGVVIDLTLTHTALGFLVGARRPTISRGLKTLAEEGLLVQRDGAWVLAMGSRDRLCGAGADAPSDDLGSEPSTLPGGRLAVAVPAPDGRAAAPPPGSPVTAAHPRGPRAAAADADHPRPPSPLGGGANALIELVGVDRRVTGIVAERHLVRYAADAAAAARTLQELSPAVLVVDLAVALRAGRAAWSELLTGLRTRPELAHTRLIILIERRLANAAATGLKAAAHDLMIKPVEPAELVKRIDSQLALIPGSRWWLGVEPAAEAERQRGLR